MHHTSPQDFELRGYVKSGGPEWDASAPPKLVPHSIIVRSGRIERIDPLSHLTPAEQRLIIAPGGVNSHVHPESNGVTLLQSAPHYAAHGTTMLVTDFHEAGNVGGIEYVLGLIELAKRTPLTYAHGAPSSVPSDARWEIVGTEPFGPRQIETLFDHGCTHLAEVMWYMGVINGVPSVHQLLDVAERYGLPIDGHAVGLDATQAKAYFERISSNHECTALEEAEHQAKLGVRIWIRRGSAAMNFDALWPLLLSYPHLTGFCTDDLHPDGLLAGKGTFSQVQDAVLGHGVPLVNAIQAWCYNPRLHYRVGGLLRVGDPAEMVVLETDSIERPTTFSVKASYADGRKLAEDSHPLFSAELPGVGMFDSTWRRARQVAPDELRLAAQSGNLLVMCAEEGSLIKVGQTFEPKIEGGLVVSDLDRDIIKAGGLCRYRDDMSPSVCFLHGFGIKRRMAMVTTPAHDRHSILYLGSDDEMIAKAINMVIEAKGGLALVSEDHCELLPLPICGLMSDLPIEEVASRYARLEQIVSRELSDGRMSAPFMTLSFMGLIVIPQLGIGDDGLYRMGANGPEPVESLFV